MRKLFSILFATVLLVSLGLVTAAPVAAATTIHVPADYATIQAAIDAAGSGDTIVVAAGEYDAFQVQGKSNLNIIGAAGATVTTANFFAVDIGPILGNIGVMAGVNASENIDIEGISFDGSELSEEENVCGIAYVDSTGRLADLTAANIIGTGWYLGAVAIIGDAGTSVVDLSDITVENSGVGVAIFNAEANINGCTTTENLLAGILMGWPLGGDWFAPSTVTMHGSTISDNDLVGIYVCDNSILEAHFNNIVGNTDSGVLNDGGGTVDATYNWWGAASGPYHETLNPDGTGDEVSDNVDFEPWLESASVTQMVTNGIVDAIDEAATIVEVDNGTAMVTISKYAGNPYPKIPIEGEGELASLNVGTLQTDRVAVEDSFLDLYVPYWTPGTIVTIKIYYTDQQIGDGDEADLRACWTNEDDPEYYLQCNPSYVNTADQPNINGHDYSGFIVAIVRDNNTTSPRMGQLTGTTFGGYGSGGTLPRQGCGGCFIATAAYGTDTAGQLDVLRAFRDTTLLQTSLGTKLVSFYYRTSPPIADFISRHEVLRTMVRVGFIDPLVRALSWTHNLWSG
jgi:hypothetical protein